MVSITERFLNIILSNSSIRRFSIIGLQSGNNVYALAEQHSKQVLENIPFVGIKFAEKLLFENFKNSCVAIVGIAGR
jgi:hypothetical protein